MRCCVCAVDTQLPQASLMFLNSVLNVAGGLGLIILSTPATVVALVPLFAVYYRVQVRFSSWLLWLLLLLLVCSLWCCS